MQVIKQFLVSLFSRKFMVTCLGIALLYMNDQYSEMVVVILGYVGVQGVSDVVKNYKSGTLDASVIENAMSQNIDVEVDTSKVVTGKPMPMFDQTPADE